MAWEHCYADTLWPHLEAGERCRFFPLYSGLRPDITFGYNGHIVTIVKKIVNRHNGWVSYVIEADDGWRSERYREELVPTGQTILFGHFD